MENSVKVEKKRGLMSIKLYGLPLPIYLFFGLAVTACAFLEIIPVELLGGVAVLFTMGILLGELGDRIPIWKDYLGGGAILAFLVGGLLAFNNLLPVCVVENIAGWMSGYNFLNMFIAVLITGSLLGVNRKLLIKSFGFYLPAILAGVLGAALLGILVGFLFGKSPLEIITMYVLPIMGGGTGAGAIPLSQIYAEITGNSAESFLSFAIPILTIANLLSVLFATALNVIGKKFPNLTGEGDLVKASRNINMEELTEKETKVKVGPEEIGAALFLAAGFFMLAHLFSKVLIPTVFGVPIHTFAYLIIFVAVANALNVIPENIKQGAQALQSFFGNKLLWIQMIGMGIVYTNFDEVIGVLTVPNLLIAFSVVLGAVLACMAFSFLIGFYPVECAITAGLCMANMGGAGDLAVLGACKRMNLMSFAQISSRIGGGMVLLIGSMIFGFM